MMKIKTFAAQSISEALNMIKTEMGPEAVVLSTKSRRDRGGAFGRIGKRMYEITAATDYESESGSKGTYNLKDLRSKSAEKEYDETFVQNTSPFDALKSEFYDLKSAIEGHFNGGNCTLDFSGELNVLKNYMHEIRDVMNHIAMPDSHILKNRYHQNLCTLYAMMVKKGVNVKHALSKVTDMHEKIAGKKLEDRKFLLRYLKRNLLEDIKVSGPLRCAKGKCKVVALVGPTGVGKTTTIAKLAAAYHLKKGKDIALFSMDTFRIAAVEQLKIYSRIIGVPLRVITSPEMLKRELKKYRDLDLILIDTSGVNCRDNEKMGLLSEYFKKSTEVEKHLVVSSTMKEHELRMVMDSFGALGIDRLIFSKIDEGIHFGDIYNQIIYTQKPLSYLTNGQKVPEDIEVASSEKIANLILN